MMLGLMTATLIEILILQEMVMLVSMPQLLQVLVLNVKALDKEKHIP